MEYMLLIASDETAAPARGTPEFDQFMGGWMQFNQLLVDGGHFIAGAGLQPTATATTVRKSGSGEQIVDGPFAETKEQLGGFYLIAAADLDQALSLARALPIPAGSVEVRPLSFRPDAR